VGLIIRREGGVWNRYALTDRAMDGLKLNVEEGTYKYDGPLYQIMEGYQLSRSELHTSSIPSHLRKVQARIEIQFAGEKYDPVDVPFAMAPEYQKMIPHEFLDQIREWHPQLENLGWHMTPHRVKVKQGKILLQDPAGPQEFSVVSEKRWGRRRMRSSRTSVGRSSTTTISAPCLRRPGLST